MNKMNHSFTLEDDVINIDRGGNGGLFMDSNESDASGSTLLDNILPDIMPQLPTSSSSARASVNRRAAASAAISALGKTEAELPDTDMKRALYHTPTSLSATANGFSDPITAMTSYSAAPNSGSNSSSAMPGFVSKLYKMLSDPTISGMISWSPEGNSFIVLNPEDFARLVLPHFFKHNNFSSFVRQLNMYGFHKVPHLQQGSIAAATAAAMDPATSPAMSASMWEFAHPSFQQNRPDLLGYIRRKLGREDGTPATPISETHSTPQARTNGVISRTVVPANSSAFSTSSDVIRTVESLRQELTALRQQQTALFSDLQSIHRDNQLLWSENLASRERHSQQQQVIDRILRFLASVFSPAGNDGRLTGAAANLIAGLDSNLSASASPSVTSSLGPSGRNKRPLMLLEDAHSTNKMARGLEDFDFRRQVLELIESNNQHQHPQPSEESSKSQHSRKIHDLRSTSQNIARDISLVDEEIVSLTGKVPMPSYGKEDDFDFSNYLNVQSLE